MYFRVLFEGESASYRPPRHPATLIAWGNPSRVAAHRRGVAPTELEAFEWYCEKCEARVHRRDFQLRDIKTDLVPVFEEYYGDPSLRKCPACDHQNPGKPGN